MARLLLLGSQVEEIDAVVISLYTITDERGCVVCGANTETEAKLKVCDLAAKYPDHRFSYR